MSSDDDAMTAVHTEAHVGAGPRRAGTWFAATALVALAPVLPLWLFISDPGLRQFAILLVLGLAACCLVVIALYQRGAGGQRPFHAVAVGEFSKPAGGYGAHASEPSAVPRLLPSRRALQWRSLGWYAGVCTALVALFSLAAGSPQRPELMQRIYDAGAEFASVRIERVNDVQFHDPSRGRPYYTSTAVVRLSDGANGADATAVVHPISRDRLARGDRVAVLYAPTHPQLGAIAGDEKSLGPALRGGTLSTGVVWIAAGAWSFGMVLSLAALWVRYGFRTYSRLGSRDKAVRVTCLGADFWRQGSSKERCLRVATASSRTAHFLVNVTERDHPASLNGEQLWLCWDARRGTGGSRFSPGSTPAALVSDNGWVMHGMLKVDDARLLDAEGVSVAKAGAEERAERTLRLWDPAAAWPLFVTPSVLTLYAVLIACGVLLAFDIPDALRWVTAIVGAIGGFVLAYFIMVHDSMPPAAE